MTFHVIAKVFVIKYVFSITSFNGTLLNSNSDLTCDDWLWRISNWSTNTHFDSNLPLVIYYCFYFVTLFKVTLVFLWTIIFSGYTFLYINERINTLLFHLPILNLCELFRIARKLFIKPCFDICGLIKLKFLFAVNEHIQKWLLLPIPFMELSIINLNYKPL